MANSTPRQRKASSQGQAGGPSDNAVRCAAETVILRLKVGGPFPGVPFSRHCRSDTLPLVYQKRTHPAEAARLKAKASDLENGMKPRNLVVALAMLLVVFLLAYCKGVQGDPVSTPQPLISATPLRHSTPSPSLATSSVEAMGPVKSTSRPDTQAPTDPPTVTPTPRPWQPLAPGISQRYIPVEVPGTKAQAYVYALKIDPAYATFRIHYDRDQPRFIEQWQAETQAQIIVNGGFFTGNNTPHGRIIVDGRLFGAPLNYGDESIGVPGLFAILDDHVELHALGHASYNPRGMKFDQAIECYPLLLLPGQQPTYPVETGERARRTLIALDTAGHVVILISDLPLFSLHELAVWLAEIDLELDSALNLDGGRSSGLMVSLSAAPVLFPAYVPLPIVIGVYTRGY